MTFWKVAQDVVNAAHDFYNADVDIIMQRKSTIVDFNTVVTNSSVVGGEVVDIVKAYIDAATNLSSIGGCWCRVDVTRSWFPYGIISTAIGTTSVPGLNAIEMMAVDADGIPRDFYDHSMPNVSALLTYNHVADPSTPMSPATMVSFQGISYSPLYSTNVLNASNIAVWVPTLPPGSEPLMPGPDTCANHHSSCVYAASTVSLIEGTIECLFVCVSIISVSTNSGVSVNGLLSPSDMPIDVVYYPDKLNSTSCTGTGLTWMNQRALVSMVRASSFKEAASVVGLGTGSAGYYHYIPWINLTRNEYEETPCVVFAESYCTLRMIWYAYKSDLYCEYNRSFDAAEFDVIMVKGLYGNIGYEPAAVVAGGCGEPADGVVGQRFSANNPLTNDEPIRLLVPQILTIAAFQSSVETTPVNCVEPCRRRRAPGPGVNDVTIVRFDNVVWTNDMIMKWRIGLHDLFWVNFAGYSHGTGLNTSEAICEAQNGTNRHFYVFINDTIYIDVTFVTLWVSNFPSLDNVGCVGLNGCDDIDNSIDCDATPGCFYVTAGGSTMTSTTTGTTMNFNNLPTLPAPPTPGPPPNFITTPFSGDARGYIASLVVVILLVAVAFVVVVVAVLGYNHRHVVYRPYVPNDDTDAASDTELSIHAY